MMIILAMLAFSIILVIVGISTWSAGYHGKHRALDRNDFDMFDQELKRMHKGQIILLIGIVLLIILFFI